MKIDENLFTILRKINGDPNINQRMLAKQGQEQREYADQLIAKNNINKIINPWDARIIEKINKSEEYI